MPMVLLSWCRESDETELDEALDLCCSSAGSLYLLNSTRHQTNADDLNRLFSVVCAAKCDEH